MTYNRNRGQKYIEELLGFFSAQEFTSYLKTEYKRSVKDTRILNNSSARDLAELLQLDAKDFFFKSVLSISEALNGIYNSRYSWATVKLYYGVYYLIRTALCLENIALISANGMYYLKSDPTSTLIRMPDGGDNHSTHKGAIKMYLKLLGGSDIISLTAPIGGENPYLFLINAREVVNYREREFHEPNCSELWSRIKQDVEIIGLAETIQKYLANPQTLILNDYACLSIPLFKLKEVYNKFNTNPLIDLEQTLILDNLWKVNGDEIFNLNWLSNTDNVIYTD